MKRLDLAILLVALTTLFMVTGCGSSDTTAYVEPVQEQPNVVVNNTGDGKVIFVNGNGDIYECYDLNASGDACSTDVQIDAYYEAPIQGEL